MSTTININGEICDSRNAKISVFDRGFLFGDSIYEVTYSKQRTFIFLEEHLDRLWNSASLLNLDIQISREELKGRILETAKSANIDEAYVRVIITRGEGELNIGPGEFDQNVVIYVKPNIVYPEHLYDKGLNLIIAQRPRNDRRTLDPNAKSGNYLNNVLAVQEAKKLGADDAIMPNLNGEITEGSTFNIWMVKDGKVMTPHPEAGLLKGITRQKVLEVCKTQGIACEETKITIDQLKDADEIFITSSTKGVMPVYKLDGKTYAETRDQRPVTEKLWQCYSELIDEHLREGLNSY